MHLQSGGNEGPIICMNFILFFSIFFTHSSEEWKSHRIEIKRVWRFFLSSSWIQLLLKWEHNRFHLETFVCLLWVWVSTIDYFKHIHSFALNFQTNSNTAYYLQPRKKVHNCLLILFDCLLCCVRVCVCLWVLKRHMSCFVPRVKENVNTFFEG